MKIVTDKCRKQTHTHTHVAEAVRVRCGGGGHQICHHRSGKKGVAWFEARAAARILRVALNLACQAGATNSRLRHTPTPPLPPFPSLPLPLPLVACPFYVASRNKKEFTAILLPGDSNREQLTAQSRNDSTTILHSTHTHTHSQTSLHTFPHCLFPSPQPGILKWFMCLPAALRVWVAAAATQLIRHVTGPSANNCFSRTHPQSTCPNATTPHPPTLHPFVFFLPHLRPLHFILDNKFASRSLRFGSSWAQIKASFPKLSHVMADWLQYPVATVCWVCAIRYRECEYEIEDWGE